MYARSFCPGGQVDTKLIAAFIGCTINELALLPGFRGSVSSRSLAIGQLS